LALEEDLEQLEKLIRQLQIEWEKFFAGVERKPPNELKARLESLLRRHSNAEIRNSTWRFRCQTLMARYNTFNEMWTRRLRALEEGRPLGSGRFKITPAAPPPEAPAEGASPLEEVLVARPAPPRPRPAGEYRMSDPARDRDTVRTLFQQFLDARKQTGEPMNVKFESFEKLIAQQATRILAEKGASAVDFRLETKDGKVSLKAKPVKA
jgi:hypothetical protein